MATAMTSGAAVTGIRSWLGTRNYGWLTPERLRRTTICLFAAGLLASATLIGGSGKQPTSAHAGGSPPAARGTSR
ncbi:MAG TPA: hypothetical protein VG898_06255 [Solirubrobacterales bacterium]|nr:hypothetical protein [Solirubrobacterales bacterium]